MKVRPATMKDAAAIARVDVSSWRVAYRDLMPAAYLDGLSVVERESGFARAITGQEERGRRVLVVEDDCHVIGYATVTENETPGLGLLELMYVAPTLWRCGVGTALMVGVRAVLRDLGHSEAVLWVLEANRRARGFYEHDGWQTDEVTRDNDYGGTTLSALRYRTAL